MVFDKKNLLSFIPSFREKGTLEGFCRLKNKNFQQPIRSLLNPTEETVTKPVKTAPTYQKHFWRGRNFDQAGETKDDFRPMI
jgi:hypothetical protein